MCSIASWRSRQHLGAFKLIKIVREGQPVRFTTPDEAVRFLQLEKAKTADTGIWTVEMYWRLIERLGEKQVTLLDCLNDGPRTDAQLRGDFSLKSNQQLAGILSGISKQAAALGIPARSVFKIEKEYQAGEVITTYVLDAGFDTLMD